MAETGASHSGGKNMSLAAALPAVTADMARIFGWSARNMRTLCYVTDITGCSARIAAGTAKVRTALE
jgi:hypothetical protein